MAGNERLCKFYFKKLFLQNVLAFTDLFYRYHYIRYFIYTGCMWHMCTICTEAATGGVFQKKVSLKFFANFAACEIRKIFTNTYFEEHLWMTADQMICSRI